MRRNIPLEAGSGVELTPESISGGGDILLWRLERGTKGAKGRSFIGEELKDDIARIVDMKSSM